MDSESGLHHVRNRLYQSTLGRWVSRDPIGYDDGINLYEYVNSKVALVTDPSGLQGNGIIAEDCKTEAEKQIEQIMKDNPKFADMLKKKKPPCIIGAIDCICCKKDYPGVSAQISTADGRITICMDRQRDMDELRTTIRHEIIHLIDTCSGKDPSNCEERACTEIRAASMSGDCEAGQPWPTAVQGSNPRKVTNRADCVKAMATASVRADPNCAAGAEGYVNSVWNACYQAGPPAKGKPYPAWKKP